MFYSTDIENTVLKTRVKIGQVLGEKIFDFNLFCSSTISIKCFGEKL